MKSPQAVRVSFQGELGAFSEDATRAIWQDDDLHLHPRPDCFAAARAVRSGEADYAVLPVENTLAGSVSEAYDALCESSELVVLAERSVPIDQCLLGLPGSDLAGITVAHSHRIALAQCRGFFGQHAHIEAAPAYDTAGAARDVATRGNLNEGAIAGKSAARRYGLRVLLDKIQDRSDNQTRFWAITRSQSRPGDVSQQAERMVNLLHTCDALSSSLSPDVYRLICCAGPYAASDLQIHSTLAAFHDRQIPVVHVESRPAGIPWTHYYVLEAIFERRRHNLRDVAALFGRAALRLMGVLPHRSTNQPMGGLQLVTSESAHVA